VTDNQQRSIIKLQLKNEDEINPIELFPQRASLSNNELALFEAQVVVHTTASMHSAKRISSLTDNAVYH
jgi:hypothetical protein